MVDSPSDKVPDTGTAGDSVAPSSENRSGVCDRCGGTGLVCGHVPVIGPGNCCVDYANALCPDCKGRGRVSDSAGPASQSAPP